MPAPQKMDRLRALPLAVDDGPAEGGEGEGKDGPLVVALPLMTGGSAFGIGFDEGDSMSDLLLLELVAADGDVGVDSVPFDSSMSTGADAEDARLLPTECGFGADSKLAVEKERWMSSPPVWSRSVDDSLPRSVV